VFVQEHHISYPMVYDQIGKTALQLGDVAALALPFTILIDRQQRVAAVYANRVHPADLTRALDALLAEPAQSGGH
jgi:hypothetical protein